MKDPFGKEEQEFRGRMADLAEKYAIANGGRMTATEICLRFRQYGFTESHGLTLAKLVRARAMLDAAVVPPDAYYMPMPVPAAWFGQPPRRRNRHVRKPLAQWRERMARMEHKAQLRRWRANPEVRSHYAALRKSLEAGEVVEFMGFKFINSRPIPSQ